MPPGASWDDKKICFQIFLQNPLQRRTALYHTWAHTRAHTRTRSRTHANIHTNTHAHTCSLTCSHTRTRTHSHTPTRSLTHANIHTDTHAHTRTCSHTCTHSHTRSHMDTCSHTLTRSHIQCSHTLTHAHAHTHAHATYFCFSKQTPVHHDRENAKPQPCFRGLFACSLVMKSTVLGHARRVPADHVAEAAAQTRATSRAERMRREGPRAASQATPVLSCPHSFLGAKS